MPPRIKGVANPFAGFVITVCGRVGTIGGKKWNQQDFKTIIVKWGGRSVRNVTDATTHVVATEDSLYGDTAIMVAARRRENLSFMKPEWLIDTDTKKKKLNAKEYVWTDLEKLRASQLKTQSAKTKTAKKIAEAEARLKGGPKEVREGQPKTPVKSKATAKPKAKAKSRTMAEPTTPVKSKATAKCESKTPAKPKATAKSKATAKPKTKAKSRTMAEPTTPAKPKPTAKPLDGYHVWVDPDSGLIYDAYLNRTNAETNTDKFFRIQVMKDPNSSTFRTRTQWGRNGGTPIYQVLGNGRLEEAVKLFEKKFKSKSGLAWENRTEEAMPGEYTYKPYSGGDNDTTDHS